MLHMPRDEMIRHLANIATKMLAKHTYTLMQVSDYIHECTVEFSLIEEEQKTLTFLIMQHMINDTGGK